MKLSSPRQITATFDSVCPETGKPIRKGDQCIWYPQAKAAYHSSSRTAAVFKAETFDNLFLGANY